MSRRPSRCCFPTPAEPQRRSRPRRPLHHHHQEEEVVALRAGEGERHAVIPAVDNGVGLADLALAVLLCRPGRAQIHYSLVVLYPLLPNHAETRVPRTTVLHARGRRLSASRWPLRAPPHCG